MSEAIQAARDWLAGYDSLPVDDELRSGAADVGAESVRALLAEMALMGRRSSEAGYAWFMTNVDGQVSQAIEAGKVHNHHEEDMHLRVAMIRSNQAVAAAIHDGPPDSGWDIATAQEADAFQRIALAALHIEPGHLRDQPGYPDHQVATIIGELRSQDDITAVEVEEICDALVEAGPWDEIDGDGSSASIICDHIRTLGQMLDVLRRGDREGT